MRDGFAPIAARRSPISPASLGDPAGILGATHSRMAAGLDLLLLHRLRSGMTSGWDSDPRDVTIQVVVRRRSVYEEMREDIEHMAYRLVNRGIY